MPSLTVPGSLDSLDNIRSFVMQQAAEFGLSDRRTYRLSLAVDEIATNIIVHGYQEAGRSGMLDIRADLDGRKLIVTVEDDGEPFDPRDSKMPDSDDLLRPLEDRPVGGLGLFLAIQGVDEFQYERVGGRNRNIFVVYLYLDAQTG